MIDQLMILAESGSAASEGIPAPAVGIGAFVLFLALLGIPYLAGGGNRPGRSERTDDDSDR